MEVARKLDVPKLLLLFNKALPDYDLDELRRQGEQSYGASVAGVLPVSEDVVRLASADVFGLRYPDHPWTHEVKRVADQVMA